MYHTDITEYGHMCMIVYMSAYN